MLASDMVKAMIGGLLPANEPGISERLAALVSAVEDLNETAGKFVQMMEIAGPILFDMCDRQNRVMDLQERILKIQLVRLETAVGSPRAATHAAPPAPAATRPRPAPRPAREAPSSVPDTEPEEPADGAGDMGGDELAGVQGAGDLLSGGVKKAPAGDDDADELTRLADEAEKAKKEPGK
jgi:hypothetical protein